MLSFFLFNLSLAAEKPVEKAQQQFLSKKRKAAITTLVKELKKNSVSEKQKAKLNKALNRIVSIFISEKAMKKFSLAEATLFSDPKLATLTLDEVRNIEPHHSKVEILSIQNYLLQKQCQKALEISEQSLSLNPYNRKVKLLRLNALLCEESYREFSTEIGKSMDQSKELAFKHLMAIYSLKTQDESKYAYYLKGLRVRPEVPIIAVLETRLKKRPPGHDERVNGYLKACSQKETNKRSIELFFYCDFLDEMLEEKANIDQQEPDHA